MTWCLDWYDVLDEIGKEEYFEKKSELEDRLEEIKSENTEYEIYEVKKCKECGAWKKK